MRAIEWRLGSSMAFFAVAAVAVAAATTGPLYLTAADQSIVTSGLASVPANQTGVTITQSPSSQQGLGGVLAAASTVPGGSGTGAAQRFGPAIVTTDLASSVYSPVAGRPDGIEFVYRTGACGEVRMVAGHCPTTSDEVALSVRSAAQLRVKVGSLFEPTPSGRPGRSGADGTRAASYRLRVSGLYQPGNPAAAIWWGTDYFPFGFPFGPPNSGAEALDDGWLTAPGAARLSAVLVPTSWVQLPLHVSSITPTDITPVLNSLASWEATAEATDGVVVGSSLSGVLSAAQGEEGSARTVVLVVALQLALLALLVLYSVARATSALRSDDVRVAELRGLPRRNIAALALREPVILLTAALPAGAALAWIVVWLVDRELLGIAAPTYDTLAIATAFGAFVAGLIAAAFGSRALLRVRISEESLETAAKRRARTAGVVDAIGLALSAAGVAELIAQHSHQTGSADPLALVGPGLLALGAGILGARLLALFADTLARLTRWTRHVAAGLAARSVARRENVARQVLVPTIAAGLLAFSVAGLAVSRRNDTMQAGFQVGAPVVLRAEVRSGVNFLDAVREADPSGHEAMAVVSVNASYGETIAVDSSRFAAIASWPDDLAPRSVAALAKALRPPTPPAVTVPPGSGLVVTADLGTDVEPRPDLQLSLFDDVYMSENTVDFGFLRPGVHRYSASLAGACSGGCRLDAFTLVWVPGAHLDPRARNVSVQLRSLAEDEGGSSKVLASGFGTVGAWKVNGLASATATRSGLSIVADLADAPTPPSVQPADVPSLVPSVVTSGFATVNADPSTPDQYQAVGIDENEVPVRGIATVQALPQLGADGTMIDLGFAQLVQTGPPAGATFEVWCSHPPSATLLSRLERGGVTITGSSAARSVLRGFQRSGPSLGFDLFGIAGVAAVLLALGSLLFATASGARARGIELTGLSAVGVTRRTLYRSVVVESLMVSVAGAALGWAAGVLGASLAIGSLPEFAPGRVGPPLELGLPWTDLALSGAAVLVVLVAAALASAWLVMRQVRPDRLRMSA
ncbi:MAG TPA: FtsX-like permease family protein [Acidimicrobiales bacterium]|nr:FtsX-like permease family protein [Acidimicrobiales bacterium]